MSFNNNDAEFYFCLFFKLWDSKRIEQMLNIEMGDIELDKNLRGKNSKLRKVDLYSVLKDGRELYLEVQLNQADDIHLAQLINIIEHEELNNYVLVWMATDFKTEMLNEIDKKINSTNKNVSFYALKINVELIKYLNTLNSIYILNVIENLKILDNIKSHFVIKEIFYRLQDEKNTKCCKRKEEILDLSKKEDVMKSLLAELRKQISYYPSIHRDKNFDNNVIVLAGGKADINYNIGLDRRNFIYVQIRFGTKQKAIFDSLLEKKEEMCDKLDYLTEFDVENMKIGTYIYFRSNKRKIIIKQIARVTDRYIKTFSPYLYPSNNRKEN